MPLQILWRQLRAAQRVPLSASPATPPPMTPPACCELMRHPARTPWTRRAMPSPACVMHHKKNGGAKLQGQACHLSGHLAQKQQIYATNFAGIGRLHESGCPSLIKGVAEP
eukprot:1158084-Pelagomonas_calceolata.AAC.15